MSFQITEAFVQQYNSTVSLVSQQKQSRLEPAVRVETIRGTREAFDSIGTVEAQPRGGRHADTPQMDTPHMRRWVTSAPYNWADLVDKPDRLRMLYDPTSPYVQNAVMAFNARRIKSSSMPPLPLSGRANMAMSRKRSRPATSSRMATPV